MPANAKPDLNTSREERVLIADTESLMCELLQIRFENEGFKVVIVSSASEALNLDLSRFSIVLVDLMGESVNGLQLTAAVKRNPDTVGLPVIIMSAKASEDDIVDGLEAGADDYVAKPFSTRELIARVKSVIRRRNMMNARRLANVIRFQELTLDIGAGTAFIDGMELSLTQNEFRLLAMFLRRPNHFFDRAQIREIVWNNDSAISDRAVDTSISRLRKKLFDYSRNLVNRKGFGYGFVE
ncbi:MAG: response regulator transcription factor [Paramuribaculum sp.]|nr:response regulator transcription factor [Paramuribaculum sp.]